MVQKQAQLAVSKILFLIFPRNLNLSFDTTTVNCLCYMQIVHEYFLLIDTTGESVSSQ